MAQLMSSPHLLRSQLSDLDRSHDSRDDENASPTSLCDDYEVERMESEFQAQAQVAVQNLFDMMDVAQDLTSARPKKQHRLSFHELPQIDDFNASRPRSVPPELEVPNTEFEETTEQVSPSSSPQELTSPSNQLLSPSQSAESLSKTPERPEQERALTPRSPHLHQKSLAPEIQEAWTPVVAVEQTVTAELLIESKATEQQSVTVTESITVIEAVDSKQSQADQGIAEVMKMIDSESDVVMIPAVEPAAVESVEPAVPEPAAAMDPDVETSVPSDPDTPETEIYGSQDETPIDAAPEPLASEPSASEAVAGMEEILMSSKLDQDTQKLLLAVNVTEELKTKEEYTERLRQIIDEAPQKPSPPLEELHETVAEAAKLHPQELLDAARAELQKQFFRREEELSRQIEALKAGLEAKDLAFKQKQAELERVQMELEKERKESLAKDQKLAQLNARIQKVEAEFATLQRQCVKYEAQFHQRERMIEELKAKLAKKDEEVVAVKKRMTQLESTVGTMTKQFSELQRLASKSRVPFLQLFFGIQIIALIIFVLSDMGTPAPQTHFYT